MARPTSRKRSPLARALIELRGKLGETQQGMAVRLGTTTTSIARYETAGVQPHGVLLANLWLIARENDARDVMKVLDQALQELRKSERRRVDQWLQQHERWRKLESASARLTELADHLVEEGHPSAPELSVLGYEITAIAKEGWTSSMWNL